MKLSSSPLCDSLEYPRHLQRNLCVLVQIIRWQTQNLILQTPRRFEIAAPVLVKDPGVHELREAEEVALFQLVASGPVAVDGRFVADFPIADLGLRHAHDRVQHVPLADFERGNVDEPVPEPRQAGAPVAFVFREDFHPQQTGDGPTALRQRARVDARVAVVEQGHGPAFEVEAVARRTRRQAVLVPEAAGDADVGADAQLLNLLAVGGVGFAERDVLVQARVQRVVAVLVGQYPGDLGRRRGFDEPRLLFHRRASVHGDDEGVLALEGCHHGFVVVVGNLFDLDAGGDGVCAVGAREGGYLVLSGSEQLFGDVFAHSTTGLLFRGFQLCFYKNNGHGFI